MSLKLTPPQPPTWILAGPTACGKTAAALALVEPVQGLVGIAHALGHLLGRSPIRASAAVS